jgi:hypothetical protein
MKSKTKPKQLPKQVFTKDEIDEACMFSPLGSKMPSLTAYEIWASKENANGEEIVLVAEVRDWSLSPTSYQDIDGVRFYLLTRVGAESFDAAIARLG